MPLYEYQCDKCGGRFEVLQKFSDPPLEAHQDCGGAVVRLISAPGLQFKGSGWYITDYARNAGGAEKGGEKPKPESKGETKAAESKSSGDTKSESKPATTATKSD